MPHFDENATFTGGALNVAGASSGAAATGGMIPYSYISAATTNSTLISAGAHQIYSIELFNTTASNKFVRFFDKATAPTVGTDVPVKRIMVPAGGGVVAGFTVGQAFASGIGFDITGALGDADATVVAVGDVFVNVGWK